MPTDVNIHNMHPSVNDKYPAIYTGMWYILVQTMDAELMCVDGSLPIL